MKKHLLVLLVSYSHLSFALAIPSGNSTLCTNIKPTACPNGYIVYMDSCYQSEYDRYDNTYAQPKWKPLLDNKGNPVSCNKK